MLRFCASVWNYARNMKSILAASVAAGALTAPAVLFAVSSNNTVTIFDFGYDPVSIRVPVGQTVTWSYTIGSTFHTVTAEDGTFDSSPPLLMPGQTFAFTFTHAGVYVYHCDLHSFMTGQVVVFGSPHDANNDGKSDIVWREAGGPLRMAGISNGCRVRPESRSKNRSRK